VFARQKQVRRRNQAAIRFRAVGLKNDFLNQLAGLYGYQAL
jgi:hypothetical protein